MNGEGSCYEKKVLWRKKDCNGRDLNWFKGGSERIC